MTRSERKAAAEARLRERKLDIAVSVRKRVQAGKDFMASLREEALDIDRQMKNNPQRAQEILQAWASYNRDIQLTVERSEECQRKSQEELERFNQGSESILDVGTKIW